MGNNESVDLEVKPQDIVQLNMPIPDLGVVEKKFSLVLNSMNLPPDKARLLRQYDSLKKWDLICDQERFQVKNQPQTYICKLQGYLDHGVTQKKFLQRVQESMKVLQDLEISLRTNHIGWVREFLNNENKGLCVLVEYLCFARRAVLCSSLTNNKTANNSRLVSQTDDVHICVMCLRAVMNYQYGFNLVMSHPHAVNEIALSLNNKNSRTKTLVLELLAAVCLVRGGHEITLSAFDNFKEVCKENHRFEKLMEYFRCEDENMDFMVACMQFINIIVHSVEDMNFRVHLQYEFTKLGLDAFLEKCRHMESEKLLVQIQTYLDNLLDVGLILKDAKAKNMALEKIEELEDQLSHVTEKLLGVENDAMMKVAELEKKVFKKDQDLFTIKETFNPTSSQIHTLHRLIQAKDGTYQRQFNSKKELQDLEQQGLIHLQQPQEGVAVKALCPVYGGDIPVPPPLPVAPPLPGTSQSVILSVGLSAVRIKKPIKTKFRLPVFNWTALKPNQINGTVFNEIDDEKVLEELDLDKFEELFKTKAQGPVMDLSSPKAKGAQKAINRFTLLDVNRSKNLAITLRKANKSTEEICKAIQMFDLKALSVDFVECLLRFLPTEAETRLLRQYEHDRQPLDQLAKEDHFMLNFGKIERLSQRITIIIFVGNFADSVNMLMPQLNAIISASTSVKSSPKLKRMLEIILALGNYMNSSTRGSVYGFKLQSLDLLLDTKSTDRKMSLFHYIALIVKEKYPELANFSSELHLVDKAAAVSLENVLLDVLELGKGMELVRRECCLHDHAVLKDFLQTNNPQLEKLQEDAKTAAEAFDNVVLYFGENPKTMPPSVFFSVFVRFIKAYEDAVEDNGQRKKQEKAMQFVQDVRKQDPKTQTQRRRHLQRHEHIAELRRQQPSNRRPVYEGKDGTIGDILTDLWNQPFQRTDAVKRLGQ